MSEKIISAAYGILGVAVWGGTIGILIFVIVLFCTAQNREHIFQINSVEICEAADTDSELISKTDSVDGWYRADYNVTVTAPRLSPFIYRAESLELINDDTSVGYFLSESGNICYSATVPCTFEITLFIRSNDINSAKAFAESSSFRLDEFEQHFSILYSELSDGIPEFSVGELLTD